MSKAIWSNVQGETSKQDLATRLAFESLTCKPFPGKSENNINIFNTLTFLKRNASFSLFGSRFENRGLWGSSNQAGGFSRLTRRDAY